VSLSPTSGHTPRCAFGVDVERSGNAATVAPWGELDIATVRVLEDRLDELRQIGCASVVLDLRQLEFIDSSGVHLALQQHALAQLEGHSFELIAGGRSVQRVFEILGLLDTLPFRKREAA
jgi:anti-anti-sigma factor